MTQLVSVLSALRSRMAAAREDEGGFAVAEALAYTALAVAVLIILFAALQVLGLDVIALVRRQIGA